MIMGFVLSSLLFPFLAWFAVVFLFDAMGAAEWLVGTPATLDPGAALVALLYVVPCTVLIAHYIRHGTRRAVVATALGTAFFSLYAFVITSSLIWL